MKRSHIAGAVVVGGRGHILIVNQNGDSWSLPKGHIEPGETEEQAAIRETREESGLGNLTYIKKLGTYERYRTGVGGVGEDTSELKVINIHFFVADEVELKPTDPTNPAASWVEPQNVSKLLTHPKDKEFFESVLPEIKRVLKDI